MCTSVVLLRVCILVLSMVSYYIHNDLTTILFLYKKKKREDKYEYRCNSHAADMREV